ncbi:MAG: helix-turn-helix domain-containing protein [Acidobacteriaceae bacterium]|nr:helix-turn-helix domain-containing protein [Acidobacteriaceae bacterium]
MADPALAILVKAVAEEVASMLKGQLARSVEIQPVLLTVKQAAVYLGRSEQAVQHLIFQRELPVVRVGRRVHLDRRDLDKWIEKNKS